MRNCTPAFLLSLLLLCTVTFFSCNNEDESRHEMRYSADGKDSIVYVHYRDNNGQYQDFFLNYMMFRTLFGNGGYSACHNYYTSNPGVRINNYHTYAVREDRTQSTRNYSSGSSSSSNSNSNSNNSSKSYSSPSRSSSSSRSYSSPSRSYSSPSRSYSSPSRSYSSPSRSYSSPSRH